MTSSARRVVLFGCDSGFFEYAGFQLATGGLETVPVLVPSGLSQAIRDTRPCAVLLHWDTLGDACWRACTIAKSLVAAPAPVVVLAERLHNGPNIVATFASGADGLIEGALNPRILMTRLRALMQSPRAERHALAR